MDIRYKILLALALPVIALDQLTKKLVLDHLPLHSSRPIIDGFFNLVSVRNTGAAFGLLGAQGGWQFWLFAGAAILAVAVILWLAKSAAPRSWELFCGLGLILGGAVGNFIDRLRYREVVDFLDFYINNWHWPAFNVADIAICCGAGLLALSMWRQPGAEVGNK